MAQEETSSKKKKNSLEPGETLGDFFKRERILRGYSLEEIAMATRIPFRSLRALEENDRNSLPAEVYVRGFIREYARYIGIDPQEVMGRYVLKSGGETEEFRPERVAADLFASKGMTESVRLFSRRRIVFGVIILLVLGVAYWGGNKMNRLALHSGGRTSFFETLRHLAGEDQPPLPAVPAAQQSSGLPPAVSPSLSGSIPAGSSGSQGATGTFENVARSGQAENPSLIDQMAAQIAGQDEGRTNRYVLEAYFREVTWLRVKVDSDQPQDHTFQVGDRQVWKAKEKIDLYIGNAGGIELTLNGKSLGPLGETGKAINFNLP